MLYHNTKNILKVASKEFYLLLCLKHLETFAFTRLIWVSELSTFYLFTHILMNFLSSF